jgi:hypothetical protein
MKTPKSKENLIQKVIEQIKEDVHCGYYESLEGLLEDLPAENLIAYLPEEDWKPFNHLVAEEHLKKEKDGGTT